MVNHELGVSYDLRDLLFKLGIKSAEIPSLESMIRNATQNFGRPDVLVMDSKSYQAYGKLIKGVK